MTENIEQQLAEIIQDPKRRFSSLYQIKDAQAKKVLFKPNAVQRALSDNLWWLNLVLKSRQHGITTWACIQALDLALWNPGYRCGIVAHTKDDANKFFRDKILFAYDNLDPVVQAMVPIKRRDLGGTLEFENGSIIEVSVSHRGGTFQFLHISEYGPMCGMFPQRAEEVRAGALNTVHEGAVVTIESTAYGREGDFYTRCMRAIGQDQRVQAETLKLTRMDYRFFFFGWMDDPKNVLREVVDISDDDAKYFEEIEAQTGKSLILPQKYWYIKKAEDQTDKMNQEHPSTPGEAFAGSRAGSYYAIHIAKARKEGRVTNVPILPHVPINTFWDLGRNDMMAIWLHQHVGLEHRFVAYMEDAGPALSHYAKWLIDFKEEHGVIFGRHYLPHDANVVELTRDDGKSRKMVLEGLGIRPTVLVPKIEELGEGIDAVRRMFPTAWFHTSRGVDLGLQRLEQYQKKWNQQAQSYQDVPLKNDARNGADAFRQWAQGYTEHVDHKPKARKRYTNWKIA